MMSTRGSLFAYGRSMVRRTARRNAYREFRRYYETWGAATFGPYHKELTSTEEASNAVRIYFDLLRRANYHKPPEKCLRLLLWPEFGFNIKRTMASFGPVMIEHGAGNPLPLNILQVLEATFLDEMAKLPFGYLAVVGGVAHDTGVKKPNGKKRGINLGWLIESGGMTEHLTFSKFHRSNIDLWPSDIEPDTGTGPFDYTVKDPQGGRPVQFTGIICLDAAAGPYTDLMKKSDLIAICSYGTPFWKRKWIEERVISPYAEVAVADTMVGQDPEGDRVGTFARAPEPKYPTLKGLHQMAGDGWLGDTLLAGYERFLSLNPTEVLSTVSGFQKLEYTRYSNDELFMTVVQDRPLPQQTVFPAVEVTEAETSTTEKATETTTGKRPEKTTDKSTGTTPTVTAKEKEKDTSTGEKNQT